VSIKLCPRCHAVRNMVVTTSIRMTTGPKGKLKQIRTKLFHCETCNSFVHSEDTDRNGRFCFVNSTCQPCAKETFLNLGGKKVEKVWYKCKKERVDVRGKSLQDE